MFLNRNVSRVGGTLILLSTVLSIAHATPATQPALTPVETFAAPSFARVNAGATPALDARIGLVFPMVFKKKAQLDALIQAQQDPTSPQYHHFLTQAQIGKRFGADEADLRAIVQYAQSQGFTITNVWPNHLFVSASANVAQVEKAFHIQLMGYERPKSMIQEGDPTTFFAPDRKPTIPSDIAARITSIHGLTNFLIPHTSLSHRALGSKGQAGVSAPQGPGNRQAASLHGHPSSSFSGPLSPAQISTFYDLDGLHSLGANGQGMNVAVFSPTLFKVSDVQAFASNYSITGWTVNEKWVTNNGTSERTTSSGGSGEAALDCEILIGQANKATVTLYENDGSNPNYILDSWNQIATDAAPVVSCSWGYYEGQLVSYASFVSSWDAILQTMAAAGQSIFVATGDQGADDVTGAFGVSYPSTSSYVTAVGGTQNLTHTNGAWASEQGWSGSGGGLSVLISQPTWQTGPGVKNTYSNKKRQIPDVAALAAPGSPGYYIYVNGTPGDWGGTSASTPLWASAILLMDQLTKQTKGLGNLNPLVYQLNGTSVNPAFHDIMTGSNATGNTNGAYPCTVGWDFVTGWGSADFTNLYTALYPPAKVSSLTLNPTSVAGGNTSTGTVTLAAAAPTGGASVTLTSNSASATVVSPLTVAAGQTSATFTISTTAVTANTNATITASANGSSQSATLAITPAVPALSAITLSASSTIGGTKNLTGTATLNVPATANGTITFTTSNSGVTVASVSIVKGQSSASFSVATSIVSASTTVTVTASYSNSTASTTFTDLPLAISSLVLNPTSVVGSQQNATGTITLNGAPKSAQTVTLASSITAAATVPTSVTIAANATTGTFTVTSKKVTTNTTSTISATLLGATQSSTLTVVPLPLVLTVSPNPVAAGHNVVGVISLTTAAPTGGLAVTLTSNSAAATVPTTVTVPAGQTTMRFLIATQTVTADTNVTVTAQAGALSSTATLTVQAIRLKSISFSPNTIQGGFSTYLTISLTGTAPAAGIVVTLTSSNPSVLAVPATVTLSGTNSVTIQLDTQFVSTATSIPITAMSGSVTLTTILTVTP